MKKIGVNRMIPAAAMYGRIALSDRCGMSRNAQYAVASQMMTRYSPIARMPNWTMSLLMMSLSDELIWLRMSSMRLGRCLRGRQPGPIIGTGDGAESLGAV